MSSPEARAAFRESVRHFGVAKRVDFAVRLKREARHILRHELTPFSASRLGEIMWEVNELGGDCHALLETVLRSFRQTSNIRAFLNVEPVHGRVPSVQANSPLVQHLDRRMQAALIARHLNYENSSAAHALANVEAFSDEAVEWVNELLSSTAVPFSVSTPKRVRQYWLSRPESAAALADFLTPVQHLELALRLVGDPVKKPTATTTALSAFVAVGDVLAIISSVEWRSRSNELRAYTSNPVVAQLCLESVQARNGDFTNGEHSVLRVLGIEALMKLSGPMYRVIPDVRSPLFLANTGLVKVAAKGALATRAPALGSHLCKQFFSNLCQQTNLGRDALLDFLEDKNVRYFVMSYAAPIKARRPYGELYFSYEALCRRNARSARRLAEAAARSGLSLEAKYDKAAEQAPHLQEVHFTLPTFLLGLAPPANQAEDEDEGEDEDEEVQYVHNHPLVNFAQHKTFDVNLLGIIASCLGGEGVQGGFLKHRAASSSSSSSRPLKRSRVD